MSTTIVKADLGRIPGFVCVVNDIVYLVVNSQMGLVLRLLRERQSV